jgi:peptidoglycan hydrolase-like protein with peptidoglycan-binding domain
MRKSLCKRNFRGLLLAALTAGTLTVPAVSAQSASSQPKKSAHKPHSSSATASHSNTTTHTSTTTTTHSKPSVATTTTHSKTPKNSSKKRTKKVKGQAAPTPERISEIQDALAKRGMLTGTPSGKWDDDTVEAMKKFQSSNGLNPSGKLDALTLQKLGLGSETAGLAAPIAPPNSTNRLRSAASLPPEPNDNN